MQQESKGGKKVNMAEFLIYNKNHWSVGVKLTEAQIKKFSSCYKKGDIIEVRPDGYWDKRGFDKESFAVVKKTGMSVESAEKYAEPFTKEVATVEKDVFDAVVIEKRKYQVTNIIDATDKIAIVDTLTINTKTEVVLSTLEDSR